MPKLLPDQTPEESGSSSRSPVVGDVESLRAAEHYSDVHLEKGQQLQARQTEFQELVRRRMHLLETRSALTFARMTRRPSRSYPSFCLGKRRWQVPAGGISTTPSLPLRGPFESPPTTMPCASSSRSFRCGSGRRARRSSISPYSKSD